MDKKELPMMESTGRTCPGQMEVPTPKEQEALGAMRSIKERVREMKGRLSRLKDTGPGRDVVKIADLENELARLKTEWDLWEEKRRAAARERMIILGHEEDRDIHHP